MQTMLRLVYFAIAAGICFGQPAPSFQVTSILPPDAQRPVPLAPGLLISLYGEHLGPTSSCQGYGDQQVRETPSPLRPRQSFNETLIFPKELCDTQVLVGGVPAGLLYVQERQINFKVPQETPVEGSTEVRVIHGGRSSPPVNVPVGLDNTTLYLEGPTKVGMPVWLKIYMPGGNGEIRYPFRIWPAAFGCQEVQVRRNGRPLPRIADMASQAFGQLTMNGNPCSFIGLNEESHHLGRLPLHLQYRFDEPGTYEVRFVMREVQSAWTPIEILPGTPAERNRWLAERSAHAPTGQADLLTDYLPSMLGIPDKASLDLLVPYLYTPDSLVRQYVTYGLTYWPADQVTPLLLQSLQRTGPSDVLVQFLVAHGESPVDASIPYLQSDSPILLRGAVTAAKFPVPQRAEAALINAEDHIVKTADGQTICDYVMALGASRDDRASSVLWNLIHRDVAREQAMIALTWRKSVADLPKLAQLALAPANGKPLDYKMASLPYALRNGYGEAAVPYLETLLERSEFTWVRTNSARELVRAGRPAGFAFMVDAMENGRRYRLEMIQFIRDQFPELAQADDPEILTFLKTRAVKK